MHLLIDSAEGWERVTEFPHIQVMAKCGIYMALPPRLCLLEVRMQSGRLRDLIGRAVVADFYRLRSPEGRISISIRSSSGGCAPKVRRSISG
jgi:hypothetical protein